MTGWGFIFLTLLVTTIGCLFLVYGHVGLAQFCFVLASGMAGGAAGMFIEKKRDEKGGRDYL